LRKRCDGQKDHVGEVGVANISTCSSSSMIGSNARRRAVSSSADPEARWAGWQRVRRAGVLSPNDVRAEEGQKLVSHDPLPTPPSDAPFRLR
jgi:hypothetical protein